MYNQTIFEQGFDIHPFFFEQDANTDIAGDWLHMRDYGRAYVLLIKAGTEDVDTLGIQFLQGLTNSGGSSKGVNCRRVWYKTGTMTGQGTWTPVTVGSGTPDDIVSFGSSAASGGTLVTSDVNTDALYLLCEILAEDFDVANGFKWLGVAVEGDEVNNTCLVSCLGILSNGHLHQAVPLTPLA